VGLAARLAGVVAVVMAIAAPAAVAQVPGAHYTGTTDQNHPIGFDVTPDGQGITNVVTSYGAFCTFPGPSTLQIYGVNSTFTFPVNGGTISGRDDDGRPVIDMAGTFSGQDAAGTLSGYGGGSSGGTFYFCNALERKWSASTTAAGPGGDPGGGDSGSGGNPGGAAGSPAVQIAWPSGVLLKPSLSSGVVVRIVLDQPATLSGKLVLSAKDAKKYGLGKRAVVISKATSPLGASDPALEFTFKKSVARKLKRAKKLKLKLQVTAANAGGQQGRGERTLAFG
jgi:hypothetical protein